MQRRTVLQSIAALLLAPLAAFGKQVVPQATAPVIVDDPPILLEDMGLPSLPDGSIFIRAVGTHQQMQSLSETYTSSAPARVGAIPLAGYPWHTLIPQISRSYVFFVVSNVRVPHASPNAKAVAAALHAHHCEASLELVQQLLNFGIIVEPIRTTYRDSVDQSGVAGVAYTSRS